MDFHKGLINLLCGCRIQSQFTCLGHKFSVSFFFFSFTRNFSSFKWLQLMNGQGFFSPCLFKSDHGVKLENCLLFIQSGREAKDVGSWLSAAQSKRNHFFLWEGAALLQDGRELSWALKCCSQTRTFKETKDEFFKSAFPLCPSVSLELHLLNCHPPW